MSEVKFTDQNFNETALSSPKLVLVDFYATWCGPCQMMAPHIEELANEYSDVVIGKLDVDENPEIAQKYQVMSIPTIVFIKNGEVVEKLVGYQSKDALEEKLDALK